MFKCIGLNNYGVGTRDATSTLFTLCATGILFFDTGRSRMQQKKGREKNESRPEKTESAVVTLTTATACVASMKLVSVFDLKRTSKTTYKKG